MMLFQDSSGFGGYMDKEDINKDDLKHLKSMLGEWEIFKYYDETWWNYFQVSGWEKELRNIWLNAALGEGQSQVGDTDGVCIKRIQLHESWQELRGLGTLQLKGVQICIWRSID